MININNVWLAVNYGCNNRCIWCYSEDQISKTMPLGLACSTIDILPNLGVRHLILIGGEPTLHPNLFDIIRYSRGKGLGTGLVTNGRKLSNNKYLKDLCNTKLNGLSISIEGSCPEIHDNITRVEGSYEQTVKGIKNYIEINDKISTTTTICKENINDLENIINVLSEIGVKDIGFNICTPSPNNDSNESCINPQDASKLIETLYLHGKSHGISVKSITPLPLCNIDSIIRDEMLSKNLLHRFCQMYIGSGFAVDPDGNILPCVHWPEYPIGSILKNNLVISADEFIDFWENPDGLPSKFRSSLWKYPSKHCSEDKEYWGNCIGGCPLFWINHEPEKEIESLRTK